MGFRSVRGCGQPDLSYDFRGATWFQNNTQTMHGLKLGDEWRMSGSVSVGHVLQIWVCWFCESFKCVEFINTGADFRYTYQKKVRKCYKTTVSPALVKV